MDRERSTDLKVGAFVFAAFVIAAIVTFTLGAKKHLFESKLTYHIAFKQVNGLGKGSPVRVGGVTVGTVDSVVLNPSGRVGVTFSVVKEASKLICVGSVARLENKGLLGDRLVEISVGHGEQLKEGSWIPSQQSLELSEYMQKAGVILAEVESTAKNLRIATGPFADKAFGENIKSVTKNLSEFLHVATHGDGLIPRLLKDGKFADEIESAVSEVNQASSELSKTLASVRSITDGVRHDDSLAHDLLFGDKGNKLSKAVSSSMEEIAATLKQLRTGDGTAHDIIYGHKADALVDNLNEMSADLKAITKDVRAGKGSVGALLQDPSLYEDLKRLVGNLERNEILRALVRYSIRQDTMKPHVEAKVAD